MRVESDEKAEKIGYQDDQIENLSDKDLYTRCQEYGMNARVWKRRFAGLLPEVQRRGLHRRRGHGSIYEFAFKLGGMSSSAVDKVLHLAEKLEDKPVLRAQLVSGEQGWSKIEKVAFIATPETDKEWAEKVGSMTQLALEAYVQEFRFQNLNQQGFTKSDDVEDHTLKSELDHDSKFEQDWGTMSFPVSPEIEKKLRYLKYKLEKEKGVTLTFNEVFQVLMEGGTAQSAQVVVQVCPDCAARKAKEVLGRSIPAGIRRLIQAKYSGYCAFRGCTKPAISLHHTERYALSHRHDAKSIVPLCKSHERLVHTGLIENEADPPEQWRVLSKPDPNHPKFAIDLTVQKYRQASEKEAILSP